jgi:hypothetical protein
MFSIHAEFLSTGQTVNLCGKFTSKSHARNWAKANAPHDASRVVRIFLRHDMSGKMETIWHRDNNRGLGNEPDRTDQ